MSAARKENRVLAFVRAPFDVLHSLVCYRHVIWQMVRTDIRGRFAASAGGLAWHFLQPIIQVVVYLFVFVYVFGLRVDPTSGSGRSALFIMAGLFPWLIMAEGLSAGMTTIISSRNLVTKASFPIEILPASSVLAPCLSFGVSLAVLGLYSVLWLGHFAVIVLLPLVLLIQVALTLGMTLFIATLGVYFRDAIHIVQIVIGFWVFLTPILYPVSFLPGWCQSAMLLNPVYPVVALYQSIFIEGTVGHWSIPAMACGWAVVFLLCGAFVFNKLKYEFADWL